MREFEITSVERQKKSSLAEDEVGSIREFEIILVERQFFLFAEDEVGSMREFEITLVERQKKVHLLRTRSEVCGNSKSPWWSVKQKFTC